MNARSRAIELIRQAQGVLIDADMLEDFDDIVSESVSELHWEEYFEGKLGNSDFLLTIRYDNKELQGTHMVVLTFFRLYRKIPLRFRIKMAIRSFYRILRGRTTSDEVCLGQEHITRLKRAIRRL